VTSEEPSARDLTPEIAVERAGQPSVSVVVPAYNEAGLLADSLTRLHAYLCTLDDSYRWEMVVVDDGSDDGTGPLADEFAAAHARVTVIHHPENGGLGQAVRTAFRHCRSDYIVMVDSDLSYAPDHIHPLLDTIIATDAAVVAAAPYRPDAKATGVPPTRLVISRSANRLLALAAGGGLTTLTGLVRAYDGDFARSLELHESGPTVNCEILYRARERGAAVVEIPAHLDWTRLRTVRNDRQLWKLIARTTATTLAIAGRFLLLRARRALKLSRR
jgi:glycosyltransferase involved in cell wall biosynthesis